MALQGDVMELDLDRELMLYCLISWISISFWSISPLRVTGFDLIEMLI